MSLSSSSHPDPGRRPEGSVKSAVRTLEVLELLADRGGRPARLIDISDALGAPRSSVHALLRTMCASGWVRTDHSGTQYALGLRALLVGSTILDTDPYVRVARPILAELRDRLQETVHLARFDAGRVVYLVTLESGTQARSIARVGRWLPAHSTSLGKALLAARDEIPRGPLAALTDRTITDPERLAEDLRRARENGYAQENEENTVGLSCLGVALRYTTPVLDAISCSISAARLGAGKLEEVSGALVDAAHRIEQSAPVQGVF